MGGVEEVAWCREHCRSLDIVHLGDGVHFPPEDLPREITEAVGEWLTAREG